MPKYTSRYKYKMGEPVWAALEGFPWWPGHIVTIDQVTLGEQDPPKIGKDDALVEFFNDNKRFAPIKLTSLRPFLHNKYRTINKDYVGEYLPQLNEAIREAREYIKNSSFDWNSDTSKQPATQSDPDPGQDNDSDSDATAKKRKQMKMVKRKKKSFDDDPGTKRQFKKVKKEPVNSENHQDVLVAVKKEKQVHHSDDINHIQPSPKTQKPSKHDKPKRRRSVQHKNLPSIPRKRSHSENIKPIPTPDESHLKPKVKLETTMEHTIDNERAGNNHASSDPPQPNEKPSKENINTPINSSPIKRRASLRTRAQNIKKENMSIHEADADSEEDDALHIKPKSNNKKTKDAPPEASDVVSYMDEDRVEEQLAEVLMYHDYSKKDLLLTIRKLEHELRLTRRQVWDLHLEKTSLESERDTFKREIEPLIRALKEFLSIAERKKSEEEFKSAEAAAVQMINNLLRRPFHPELLRENEITASKLIKLADKSLDHSLPIGRLMRELLMLWVTEVGRYQKTKEKRQKETENSDFSSEGEKESPSPTNGNESANEENEALQPKKDTSLKKAATGEQDRIEVDVVDRRQQRSRGSRGQSENIPAKKKTKQKEQASAASSEGDGEEDGDVVMEEKDSNTPKNAEGPVEATTEPSSDPAVEMEIEKENCAAEDLSRSKPVDTEDAPMTTVTAEDRKAEPKVPGDKTLGTKDADNGKREKASNQSLEGKGHDKKSQRDEDLQAPSDGNAVEKKAVGSNQSPESVKKGSDRSSPAENRLENRIMNFTRQKCLRTLQTVLLRRFREGKVDLGNVTLNNDILEELGENLEEQIKPRREDNMEEYYNSSRLLLKVISSANQALSDVLKAVTDKSYAAVFMKKCLDGEFKKEKMGKKKP